MDLKKQATIRKIMYVVILVTATLPLACGYIMEGGDIQIWIARIQELGENLRSGNILFYPSLETVLEYRGQYSALDSNLWLVIPSVIWLLSGNMMVTYCLYMLLLNVIALFASKKMFEALFEEKETVLMGVLLYMTCPYRIYICYDKADLGMVAAWSLIPLVICGVVKVVKKESVHADIVITALAFAAVGYANGMLMFLLAVLAVVGVIWYRKWTGLISLILGGLLYLPGGIYWFRYLLKGGMEVWELPLQSIMEKGYEIGQFFTGWVYRGGKPGMGLGLLIGLFVLLWLVMTEKEMAVTKKYGFFVFAMCLMAVLSLKSFPWDVAQRLGTPFLKGISMMETLANCFGFACLGACVLVAYGVENSMKQQKLFVKIGLPLTVIFASLGTAVYMCNTLTYSRVPMLF